MKNRYSQSWNPRTPVPSHDAIRELGLDNGILPNDIQPVDPNIPLVGKVWTCSGGIVEGISQDDSLLSWTGMLSAAPSGSVVVCQPNDSTIAHMGELSAETLKLRGVKGYVVDGGNRDTDFILKLGFPSILPLSDSLRHRRTLDGPNNGRTDNHR